MRWTTSAGKTSCSSILDASGANSRRAKARTSSRMARCSSVRSITSPQPYECPSSSLLLSERPLFPSLLFPSPSRSGEKGEPFAKRRAPLPSKTGEGLRVRDTLTRLAAPALREARHVFAATQRVVQRRHVRLQILIEILVRDHRLWEDPLLGHFLPLQDHHRGDNRRPPLVGRIGRRNRGEAVVLPLAQKVLLVLTGDRRHIQAKILKPIDRAEAVDVVGDDRLRVGYVTLGEFDANNVEIGLVEDGLGR